MALNRFPPVFFETPYISNLCIYVVLLFGCTTGVLKMYLKYKFFAVDGELFPSSTAICYHFQNPHSRSNLIPIWNLGIRSFVSHISFCKLYILCVSFVVDLGGKGWCFLIQELWKGKTIHAQNQNTFLLTCLFNNLRHWGTVSYFIGYTAPRESRNFQIFFCRENQILVVCCWCGDVSWCNHASLWDPCGATKIRSYVQIITFQTSEEILKNRCWKWYQNNSFK